MVRTRVVILSGYSLFAEGVASRLRRYLQLVEFKILDPRQPDAMAQIAAAQPAVVILDSADTGVAQFCSLSNLLLEFPKLRIICLDSQHEQIQVVTSVQHTMANVRDLVGVIDQPLLEPNQATVA